MFKSLNATDVKKLLEKGVIKEALIVDDSVKHIVINIAGTNYLIQAKWESVSISAPMPDKIEERWVVTGSILGSEIKQKIFESRREAEQFVDELNGVECSLEINKVNWNTTKERLED